jgi:acyl-CoA hydrolase
MSQMDLAEANAAVRRARGRCVTVAVDDRVQAQFTEATFTFVAEDRKPRLGLRGFLSRALDLSALRVPLALSSTINKKIGL